MLRAVVQRLTRRAVLFDAGFAALLVALVWTAYTPSLKHAPRADQWCYLVDTLPYHGFWDTLRHSYSYNRTRTLGPGDTDLFRPVLFALLAAEKAACGGDLGEHQAVGIVLHLAICFLLLGLMRQFAATIRPPEPVVEGEAEPRFDSTRLLPYGVTLFFALNPAVQELVIWAHVGGYLLFLVLMLSSMSLLLRHVTTAPGSWRSASLWGAWALAVVAAFTYEMGQVYAVLAGLFLAAAAAPHAGWKRAAGLFAIFALVMPLYQGANKLDRHIHEGQFAPDDNWKLMEERIVSRGSVTNCGRFVAYTTVQPFFPSLLQVSYSGGRMQVAETLWTHEGRRAVKRTFGPAAVVSSLVVLSFVGLGGAGARRLLAGRQRLPVLMVLLPAALYAVYAAITVFGRLNVRPGGYAMTTNSYYAYFATLLLLLTAAALWPHLERAGAWASRVRAALLVGLVALTGAGAEQVREMNVAIANGCNETAQPIRALTAFVRQHRHEPDFSFAVDYANSDPVPPIFGVPVDRVMYARWMDTPRPKYVVTVRRGKLQTVSSATETAGRD